MDNEMGKPLKVLIVEDSEDDALLLVRELQRGGYEVEFERVETAEAMQSALTQKTWDLILSDYSLPKFSAPQAVEVLRASGLNVPFIIISGTIGEETAVAALKAGANDFLIKGKFTRLGSAIERELREAESRRERKRAEGQINYHARLLRHINDAVIATDDQFRITAWNRAAESIYGWTAAEVIGRSVDEILRSGFSDQQQKEARELLKENSSFRSERIHSRKNGQPVYVEENTIALIDQRGKVTGYVSVNRDITQRKQTEAALAQSNELLSRAEQTGHIGSWGWDISSNQVVWSDGLFAVFGLTPGKFDATYEAYLNYVHPDDRERVRQTIEAAFGKPEPLEYKCRILRPDGQIRTLYSRAEVVLNDQGAPAQLLGIGMDI